MPSVAPDGFHDLRVSRTTHGILQEPGPSLSRSVHVDTYTMQTFNLEQVQIQTARCAGLLWDYAPSSGLFDEHVSGASCVPGAGLGVGTVKKQVWCFQGASSLGSGL